MTHISREIELCVFIYRSYLSGIPEMRPCRRVFLSTSSKICQFAAMKMEDRKPDGIVNRYTTFDKRLLVTAEKPISPDAPSFRLSFFSGAPLPLSFQGGETFARQEGV